MITLLEDIQSYCQNLVNQFNVIPEERKEELAALSQYLFQKYEKNIRPQAIVICTHNSRRSHLGQLWLSMAAEYYQLPELNTFSGGTEATAFNPRAVAAMQRMGLLIEADDASKSNPIYQIKWKADMPPYLAFSKKYDAESNPQSDFAAIMVCTEADAGCPLVSGTDFRLPLPYDDPKAFDDTPLESQKYDERCQQIGREMMYVMQLVKKRYSEKVAN